MTYQASTLQLTNIKEAFLYNPNTPLYISREYRQFQGVDRNTGNEVLIYEYTSYSEALEALVQANHPHFMSVRACGVDPDQKSMLVVVESPETPLATIAQQRAHMIEKYTEDELLCLLGMVLSALIYAQKHGFHHSKLTLDKLYCSKGTEVKLWDWVDREELSELATMDTSQLSEPEREPRDTNMEELVQIIEQLAERVGTQASFSPEFHQLMQRMTSKTHSLEALFSHFLDFFPSISARLGFSSSGCIECKQTDPVLMCCCRSVPLCPACRQLHSLPTPSDHFIVTREQGKRLIGTENSDQIYRQLGLLNTILQELTTTIGIIEAQIKVTTESFDQFMQSVTTEKENRLKTLDNYLEKATTVRSLIQKTGETAIWSEDSDIIARLWRVPRPYFTVETKDTSALKVREHLSTLEAELYPAVYIYYPAHILVSKRIDVDESPQCISLDSTIHIDADTTMAYCYPTKLAICGSSQAPRQFLLIEASSGLIEVTVEMLFPRYRAGIVAVANLVYVFGGREIGPLAEVVGLEQASALRIADMSEANALFNPCADSSGLIYLPGRLVTRFDPQSNSYKRLFTLSFLFTTATALCVGNSLYIFTNEGLVTVDLQRMGPIRKSDIHTVGFCSNPAPKWIADKAYFCAVGESVVLCFAFSDTGVTQHQLSLA